MASKFDKQYYGEAGSRTETGTTAVTGDFCALHCITASTFTLLTDTLADANGDALTGTAIPAGTWLYGKFAAFTLSSGIVRAYKSAAL